jgi:uncharacterized protein YndB with AHSA1/START domain
MRPHVHNASAFGIECTAVFKESSQKLFNILTLDEYIEIWLSDGRGPVFCQLDARPGGQLLLQGALCDRLVHTIRGTVVHASFPMCLVIHYRERSRPNDVQRIAVMLRNLGAVTELRVTHFGLRDIYEYRAVERFWRRAIYKMTILLQSGDPKLPKLSFQPIWLGVARRLERPWIPHVMSLESTMHVREGMMRLSP